MQELTFNQSEQPLMYSGVLVATTAQIAEKLGTSKDRVNRTYLDHKNEFKPSEDFFDLSGSELKDFKNKMCETQPVGKNAKTLLLFTREGLSKLIKTINTKKAWEAYKLMSKTYFRVADADITLADEILQKNQNPEEVEWLAKRAQGKVNRNILTATMSGHGAIASYKKVTDLNNRCIIGKEAKGIREERGVKRTRDGMTTQELSLMGTLEILEAGKIKKDKCFGDKSIKKTCTRTAVDFFYLLQQSGLR